MTYPLSSEVTPGQPTAADHYNNLRKDTLYMGNAPADSLNLAGFLNRHAEHLTIEYLATNRLRIPFSVAKPPTLMINGYLLQAAANVDLQSGLFSGAAAIWYIFAVRSAGSTTFTLAVNTSSAEATNYRLIGECTWDGTTIAAVKSYFAPTTALAAADYDSGWFAVSTNTTYSQTHGLGQIPRLVICIYCNVSNGAGTQAPVTICNDGTQWFSVLSYHSTLICARTGAGSGNGVISCGNYSAGSGYYRFLAWR